MEFQKSDDEADMPTYVSAQTLANKLSVSQQTVRNWANSNVLPEGALIRIGSIYRFNMQQIIEEFAQPSKETDNV